MAIVGGLAWALLAVVVASSARRHGFDYAWYFAFSMIGGPIQAAITLSVAKTLPPRKG